MAKPKLDFKKLLLERGERLGLSVAGIITLLLLLVSLLWPGKGLFSGSPEEKAKSLIEPAVYINQRLADPNNLPGDEFKPDPKSNDKLIALNMEPIDSEKFRMASLIPAIGSGNQGRRIPKVLNVDEAVVKLHRMQLQTYMMDNTGNIYVLVGEKDSGKAGGGADRLGKMFGPKGRLGGSMGGGKGMGGPGMGGARGKFGPPPPGGGAGGGGGEEKTAKKLVALSLDKLAKRNDVTPAEQIRPLRMAIIAASFPYKAQLEEFRSKLALRNSNEVLAEMGAAKLKGKASILPAFYFTGVDVERRELDGDGNPISQYAPLNLLNDYQPYVILSGARFEDEDPDVKAISFDGLVMPRLQGFRPESTGKGEAMGGPPGPGGVGAPPGPMGKGPPGAPGGEAKTDGEKHKELYPAVERELPSLKKTLEALKGKSETEVAAPPARFRGIDNVFNPSAAPEAKDEKPMTGDVKPDTEAVREVPEHCLVRIIDLTIQPGKTYEYRLKVRMVNPNYDRRDVASPNYAKEQELPSEWSKVTLRVAVDSELHYYAVDQKKTPEGYTGPNANARIDEEKQVWLQADRWVERVRFRASEYEIGEWTVAERFAATRGEYVGRPVRVQLPVWNVEREEFVLADDLVTKGKPSIPVDFGYAANSSPQPESIAVDLQNGRQTIEKVISRTEEGVADKVAKVTDESAPEVLLLDPNGKLRLLEGAFDAADKTREERRKLARDRVLDVLKTSRKGGDGGAGAKPFGN